MLMKKLKLSRETLRQLDQEHLRALAGGEIDYQCDNTSPTNDWPYDQPCQSGGPIPTLQVTWCVNGHPTC